MHIYIYIFVCKGFKPIFIFVLIEKTSLASRGFWAYGFCCHWFTGSDFADNFRGTSIWSVETYDMYHPRKLTSPSKKRELFQKQGRTSSCSIIFWEASCWFSGVFVTFRIVQIDMDLDSEGWHFECYHAISCLGAILHTLNLRHFCLKRCWERGMLNRSTGKVQNPPKSKYQRLRENPSFTMDPECLLL